MSQHDLHYEHRHAALAGTRCNFCGAWARLRLTLYGEMTSKKYLQACAVQTHKRALWSVDIRRCTGGAELQHSIETTKPPHHTHPGDQMCLGIAGASLTAHVHCVASPAPPSPFIPVTVKKRPYNV